MLVYMKTYATENKKVILKMSVSTIHAYIHSLFIHSFIHSCLYSFIKSSISIKVTNSSLYFSIAGMVYWPISFQDQIYLLNKKSTDPLTWYDCKSLCCGHIKAVGLNQAMHVWYGVKSSTEHLAAFLQDIAVTARMIHHQKHASRNAANRPSIWENVLSALSTT